ncbi:hypothetical protein AX16_001276 [Volvariella volvacea WC 439]|nr:hypothetical protein AX16_001276 [Volvariella volvacea WC 439]
MSVDHDVAPRLPQGLERVIFELAARNSKKREIPTLMLVARRVHTWLQPVLFETLDLSADREKNPLNPSIPYPTSHQMHYVRSLFISPGFKLATDEQKLRYRPDFRTVVSQCPNLQNFAILYGSPSNLLSQLVQVMHSPYRTVSPPGTGLLRLVMSLYQLFPEGKVDFGHEVLKDVFHLEVMDEDKINYDWKRGNGYSCMKKLRYLVLEACRIDVVRLCLEECPELKVLTVQNPTHTFEEYEELLETTRENRKWNVVTEVGDPAGPRMVFRRITNHDVYDPEEGDWPEDILSGHYEEDD